MVQLRVIDRKSLYYIDPFQPEFNLNFSKPLDFTSWKLATS